MAKTLDPEEINWVQTGFEKQAIQEFVQEVRAAVFREWIALREFVRIAFFLSTAATVRPALDVENKRRKVACVTLYMYVFVQIHHNSNVSPEPKPQSQPDQNQATDQPDLSLMINPLSSINHHSRTKNTKHIPRIWLSRRLLALL